MARGPDPKPAEQRRRKNKPERGDWVTLPAVGKKPTLPELPKRPRTREDPHGWHARTRAAWKAWREDPATTQYGPAEIAAAIELAWLMDSFVTGTEPSARAEVGKRMNELGLTPKGKRDLRWRSPTETADEEGGSPDTPKPLAEVRRLRAVV